MSSQSTSLIAPEEILSFGAVDPLFFTHTFFPKTARQASPDFHEDLWTLLENTDRYVGIEMFRGSAKTSLARICCAKRVAYAISRTILFVSSSQAHAVRSVRWLKAQITHNRAFAEFFQLSKGAKWKDDEIEIINGLENCRINVIAVGLTGQIRGLNLDDYRPDFIIIDDPDDEESTGTPEQRRKQSELFFGALQNSLAPASECPTAKMALLQTGLHREDLINTCHKDPSWTTIKEPCFVYGSGGRPEESAWPERWTFDTLMKEKRAYVARGQIHVWLREMECKIVSSETALFNPTFLKFYEDLPETMITFIGIDPASSEAKDAHKSAIVCWGVYRGKAYLLDYYTARGKNPEELWTEFFRMATTWNPRLVGIETIAYQRTLAWYFRQKMAATNTWFAIREVQDRRKKSDRIVQAHNGRLYNGQMHVRREHAEFIEALTDYTAEEDFDILDASAIALDLSTPHINSAYGEVSIFDDAPLEDDSKQFPELEVIGGCP